MYLTRFRINGARTGARKLLSSPQALHAAVMSSFAQAPADLTDGPRVLWRLDNNKPSDIVLYISSPDRPDLTHLVEQAGWPTTGSWQTYAYAPFLERITTGDLWRFRLTANPVHSIRRTPDEPTKRTAHLTPRHQLGWLLQHQDKAGFAVLEKPKENQHLEHGDGHDIIVHGHKNLNFGKTDPAKGKIGVKLVTATYDGRLRVTDADALRHTLTAGLGKGKAYGCGLMTLAPAG